MLDAYTRLVKFSFNLAIYRKWKQSFDATIFIISIVQCHKYRTSVTQKGRLNYVNVSVS